MASRQRGLQDLLRALLRLPKSPTLWFLVVVLEVFLVVLEVFL